MHLSAREHSVLFLHILLRTCFEALPQPLVIACHGSPHLNVPQNAEAVNNYILERRRRTSPMPPSKSESNTKESTGHIRTRKRKWGDRGAYGGKGFESSIEDRKDRLSKKLVHGQKRLVHVLRIAKRFEHQKLGKRISRTKQEGTPVELARLQGELEALKVRKTYWMGIRLIFLLTT